jgi:hypothetical protein
MVRLQSTISLPQCALGKLVHGTTLCILQDDARGHENSGSNGTPKAPKPTSKAGGLRVSDKTSPVVSRLCRSDPLTVGVTLTSTDMCRDAHNCAV